MYRKRITEKGLNPEEDPDIEAEIRVFLGLANEEGFPHEGVLDFAESGVDPETGTLRVRGVFSNPGPVPALVPGLFARIRMPIGEDENALLVSERAIGADQIGPYLLTVNSENIVEKKLIRIGQLVDGLRIIEEGLRPGERVIVKGVQRARPGAQVDPEQIDMKTLTASAIKAAAEAKIDHSKAAADSPKGDDTNSGGEEDKKE
jgi:membrane fusion protein (multidrug efflux system)